MYRVGQTEAINDVGRIKLYAARNESETFQIVVTAVGEALKGVTAEASDLTSINGTIETKNIGLFREHYIALNKNNTRASVIMDKYPDALIPSRNPYTGVAPAGVKYNAFPFDLKSGNNQPLWVEIYVPADASPGVYKGTVTVRTAAGKSVTVSYSLRVFNFALPKIPSLQSFFGIWEIERYYKTKWGSDRWGKLSLRYTDFLIDHRMANEYPQELDFDVDKNGKLLLDEINTGTLTVREMFDYYMNQRGMSAISMPLDSTTPFKNPFTSNRSKVIAYLRNFMAYAKSEGWFDRTYVFVIDEPESANAYRKVRQWGELIDEASPELRHLVSEQPRPNKASWGSLVGFVDIWDIQNASITKEEAKDSIAAGDQLWAYTAEHEDKFSPKWFIDYLPIEYRILSWMTVSYGMTGLEYWETCWWWTTKDPWETAPAYVDGGHHYVTGGQILYPGTMETVGFEGPIASMRFKWARDGFEDYEYLFMLKQMGKNKFVERILKKTANNWKDWTKDPDLLVRNKKKMGRKIEKLVEAR